MQRKGRLFASGRHLCFYSRLLNTKIIVPWTEVRMLARATSFDNNAPAIYISSQEEEANSLCCFSIPCNSL